MRLIFQKTFGILLSHIRRTPSTLKSSRPSLCRVDLPSIRFHLPQLIHHLHLLLGKQAAKTIVRIIPFLASISTELPFSFIFSYREHVEDLLFVDVFLSAPQPPVPY